MRGNLCRDVGIGLLALVAASNVCAGPVSDAYEPDDTPGAGSNLVEDEIAPGVFHQNHILDTGDEDWLFYDARTDQVIEITLTSNDGGFHPVVEIYDLNRAFDAAVAPLQVIGDCTQAAGNLSYTGGIPVDARFLRIINCVPIGAAPISYDFRYEIIQGGDINDLGNEYVGVVSLASTGAPLGAYILVDTGVTSVSNPVTGQYQMFLLANLEHRVRVISGEHESEEIIIPQRQSELFPIELNFPVTPIGALFRDGFE